MSRIFLATRPEIDDITVYLSKWCEKSIKYAEGQGIRVFDLRREKATRKIFESYNKKNPNLIVFNGHGSYDRVNGHANEPIIIAGVNESQLDSRIVYSIACGSARELGKKSVEAGAKSYIGYEEDFWFIYDENSVNRPLSDVEAAVFFDHSEIFINMVLKGHSVGDAYEKAKARLRENYYKVLSTEGAASDAAAYLFWDLINFKAQGDMLAVL
jgi:hypothetical protein